LSSKYDALANHFANVAPTVREVTLTFRQMEEILGFALPKSATDYRQWWGNQLDSKNRPQAAVWIEAGFLVDSVQPKKPGGWVRFRRR